MPLIRVRELCKRYKDGGASRPALADIGFDVAAGELLALVGPSGSGKTTLLNLLGCLDVPSAGSYELDGEPVQARDFDALADRRRRDLGFIFQGFGLIPVLSAFENVELALSGDDRLGRDERRQRVHALLRAVGVAELAGRRPDALSGGQQQRVAIARALVHAPRLVLADEPTASLDTETALEVMALLTALSRERATTIVFSTHDPRISGFASRVLRLRDGRIEADEHAVEPVAARARAHA
jgi:putative ABC transport system ATP-binding protein